MSKTVLITRPNYDQGTTYLFHWSKPVINSAITKGVRVLDLLGRKANRNLFRSYIDKNNPDFIFLNGHGSKSHVAGFENEVLVDLSNCKDLFANKIIYARCCESGAQLGACSVANGARAYIGYSKKFFLLCSSENITRPLTDKIAKLFLDPSNLIPISILKGNSVEIAHRKSISQMLRNVSYSLSSAATDEMKACAPLLLYDIRCQTLHGDKNACI